LIRDEDAEFHFDDSDWTWSETNFFGFYNADHHLNIGVYALFRPTIGAVSSTICFNSVRAVTPWESDFSDMRAAMPMPANRSLCDYRLANSLHVRCLDPNRLWHIGYDDGEGTRIDVEYRALMPGYDTTDPEMDPMVHTEAGKFAWGTAYNGHFDQTGTFTGEVAVRGRTYPIDCVSTMDHSWGPRPERGKPNMSWLHAHFSKDFAFHCIFGFDQRHNGEELWLAHGYVLDHGEVRGMKAGRGRVLRKQERYAERVELVLTDRNDRTYELVAEGLTTYPWQCWPNMVSFNVLARWQCEGQSGHGEIQDFFELPGLCGLNHDPDTTRPSRAL
jgi:hypothetical protein